MGIIALAAVLEPLTLPSEELAVSRTRRELTNRLSNTKLLGTLCNVTILKRVTLEVHILHISLKMSQTNDSATKCC
jgi:hypothetical protein